MNSLKFITILTAFAILAAGLPVMDAAAQKRQIKNEAPAEGGQPAPAPEKPGAKLRANWDRFRAKIESKVQGQREKAIKDMQELIRRGTLSEDEKPDVYFRIAEAYWEEAQFWWMKSEEITIDWTKEKTDPAEKKKKEDKTKFKKESDKWRGEAIKWYKEILQNYPKYKRYDEVLFFLAYNLWQDNDRVGSLKIYRELIKRFPESEYLPEAYLAFGEYYFDEGQLDKAIEAYQKVTELPDSKVRGFALYKMGWCYYNLAEWERALEKFKETVIYSDTMPGDGSRGDKIALRGEALTDYVKTYAQLNERIEADETRQKFMEVGGEADYFRMLETLAQLLFDQGNNKPAIKVFKLLIQEKPESIKIVRYQRHVITAAYRLNVKPYVIEQTKTQIEYLRGFDANPPTDAKDKELLEKEREQTEKEIATIAKVYHDEGKKQRDDKIIGYAKDMYGLFLDAFPKSKEAYDTRFYYAELLYKLKEYAKAGEQYQLVYATDPKGKHTEDTLNNAVFSLEQLVKKDYESRVADNKKKKLLGRKNPEIPKKIEIPENYQKLLEAAKLYVEKVPNGAMVVERKELIATIYYTFNHFDEANRRYADLALAHPEHKLAEKATNLFLDSFNLVQDWEGLNKKAREFLANKKLVENKPTLQTQLKKVIEESAFKLVEAYEKKEQYAEAGKRYEGFHKEFPSSYLGSRALFNAAANYEKSKDPVKAVEVRARLIEQYKDSKDSVDKDIVKKSFFAVAFTYDKMANFEKAALYYEQFADKYPDDERSKEALLRAGLYRESLGMHKESLSSRDIYLKRAARNNSYAKESCYVRFARAETWERLGDMKEAEAAYNAYINSCRQDNPDRALKTQLMLAKRKAKWDDQKKALLAIMKQYEELNKKGVKLTFGAVAAAEARYLLAMESFNKYKEVRINGANKNTLAASFKSKSTAMDTTVKEMTEVVKLGQGEWAVAALYIIGTSFREFAEEVKKLPAPKELASRPDLVDMYKFEVEQEYVNPLREKAALFFASCVKKSNELDVYNDSTKKCLNELHQAKPADFPPQYELVAERGFASELVEPRPFLLETREDREAREKAEREAARKAEEAAAEAEAAPAEAPKEGDAGKADKPTTESNESAEPDAGAGGKGKGKGGKKKKNK